MWIFPFKVKLETNVSPSSGEKTLELLDTEGFNYGTKKYLKNGDIFKTNINRTDMTVQFPQNGNGDFYIRQRFPNDIKLSKGIYPPSVEFPNGLNPLNVKQFFIKGKMKNGDIIEISSLKNYDAQMYKNALIEYEALMADVGYKMNSTVKRFLKKSIEFLKTKV